MNKLLITLTAAASLLSGCAAFNQPGPPAVSADGLQRIDDRGLDLLYIYPSTDFGRYDSLFVDELVVEFDKDWLRQQQTGDPITMEQRDKDRLQRRLQALFNEEMAGPIAAGMGYDIVAEPGPDTLVMKPALVDLRINFPDTFEPYRITVLAQNAGSMRLNLELSDGDSGQALLRIDDERRARDFGAGPFPNTLRRQSVVENTQEAINMLRRWEQSLAAAMTQNST